MQRKKTEWQTLSLSIVILMIQLQWDSAAQKFHACYLKHTHILHARYDMIGLCFSRAWLPLPPNFCSQATRKFQFFHENNILVSLDFTRSEYCGSFKFSLEDSLVCLEIIMVLFISYCTIIDVVFLYFCRGCLQYLKRVYIFTTLGI